MLRATSSLLTATKFSSPLLKPLAMGIKTVNRVTHVIFDMDGLLLDTEIIYEGMVRDIAKSFGKDYPLKVRMQIMGTTDYNTARIAIEGLDLPLTTEEFIELHHQLSRERFGDVQLMAGAERLINHLDKHDVPFALATSSGMAMANLKMLKYPHLFKLFNHKVMGSTDPDVKNGKPAPDIFLVAAARFADLPPAHQCLVFEDSPAGVAAAKAAGMQSVMVPDKIVTDAEKKDATIVLNSLEDFKPELFGLPAFDDLIEV